MTLEGEKTLQVYASPPPPRRTLKDALRGDATRFLVFEMDSLRAL
jgi:hypothetical protein